MMSPGASESLTEPVDSWKCCLRHCVHSTRVLFKYRAFCWKYKMYSHTRQITTAAVMMSAVAPLFSVHRAALGFVSTSFKYRDSTTSQKYYHSLQVWFIVFYSWYHVCFLSTSNFSHLQTIQGSDLIFNVIIVCCEKLPPVHRRTW